jgi:MoaA/NifB/PqqE/SkfB family radical SAM enzyme
MRIHTRPEGCDEGRVLGRASGPLRRWARGPAATATDSYLGSLKVIWIEPTAKCNLECVHCYSSAGIQAEDRLTVDDWADVLTQASARGCQIVQIAGGEPILFDGLLTIVEKARGLGYRYVVLYTNATLLTEGDLQGLSAYNVELVTSFYSAVEDVHDAITQRPGSFVRTVSGIRSILARGLSLEVSMVRMPQNEGQIERAIDFLLGLGVERDRIAVGPVRQAGRAGAIHADHSGAVPPGHDPYAPPCGHCPSGHLVVSSNGTVYPCILARWLPVGNVMTERLGQVLGSRQLLEFRRRANGET